ncbi:protein NO VEIN domain-containing protein [Xanthomonas arboricola]|uniref:protein NO VEIN domain-containing protein n=1 Tax=Xanthomonas arboricola TaxID=56448 RepID=UPI0011B06064|nr:DUF3883 domain-containing protein [Xanthomonas arboricola]MBB6575391.1 hypothetical protein [Xanthomonas arboricola]
MNIAKSRPVLVCNIGWMARYQGLERQPDSIVGGGKWVDENHHGHECCNFLTMPSGSVFGHFETIKGKVDRKVSIGKLGASDDADSIEHIDVIWVSTEPNGGGRRVIGYYLDAVVYRGRQLHKKPPTCQHKLDKVDSYMVSANTRNVRCLPIEERTLVLGRPPGWIGQANWWFPEHSEHADVPAFMTQVRALLARHCFLGTSRKGSCGANRTSDPERNAQVEAAAVAVVKEFYAAHPIRSVEKDNVGWDLNVFQKSDLDAQKAPFRRVEVKGLSGPDITVGVTPNEYRYIRLHMDGSLPSYRIAVVTSALSAANLHLLSYDFGQKQWIDEIRIQYVQLEVDEKTAAILTLS